MIATPQPQKMSIEQYIDWEQLQECRYEYLNGDIFTMTGSKFTHNNIALNLYRVLYPHLCSRGCRINVTDVNVQVNINNLIEIITRYFTCFLLEFTATYI